MSEPVYTKEQANKEVARLVSVANNALAEAEQLASKYGLQFNFEPAYGMGGTYYGAPDDWVKSNYYLEDEGGWVPSSRTC